MQIVIIAGGKATRLYPLTKTIPKSLVPIHDKPFFTYQIELLKKNRISQIVMCVGNLSEQIIDYYGDGRNFGVSIKYSIEDENNLLGTVGALKNAISLLDDSFFVMYGDSYLPIDFTKIFLDFKNSNKKGLMTVYKNKNNFDQSNVEITNNLVTKYKKSDPSSKFDYIDYGLLVFTKDVLNIIPSKKFVNLDFLINKLIQEKELASHIVDTRFYEIGTQSGIKDFENFIDPI